MLSLHTQTGTSNSCLLSFVWSRASLAVRLLRSCLLHLIKMSASAVLQDIIKLEVRTLRCSLLLTVSTEHPQAPPEVNRQP